MATHGRSVSFAESWHEHKWEWLAVLITGVLALVIVEQLHGFGSTDHAHGYVFVAGKPLRLGHVSNQIGPPVQVDEYGRFDILPVWHDGSVLFFYDSLGNFVGRSTLTLSASGEFDEIHLTASAAESNPTTSASME